MAFALTICVQNQSINLKIPIELLELMVMFIFAIGLGGFGVGLGGFGTGASGVALGKTGVVIDWRLCTFGET